jgi:hypothetical protein
MRYNTPQINLQSLQTIEVENLVERMWKKQFEVKKSKHPTRN